jgi:hypothetical protein
VAASYGARSTFQWEGPAEPERVAPLAEPIGGRFVPGCRSSRTRSVGRQSPDALRDCRSERRRAEPYGPGPTRRRDVVCTPDGAARTSHASTVFPGRHGACSNTNFWIQALADVAVGLRTLSVVRGSRIGRADGVTPAVVLTHRQTSRHVASKSRKGATRPGSWDW